MPKQYVFYLIWFEKVEVLLSGLNKLGTKYESGAGDIFLSYIDLLTEDLNLSPIPNPAERFVLVVGRSYEILSIVFLTLGNLASYPNDHLQLAGEEFRVS